MSEEIEDRGPLPRLVTPKCVLVAATNYVEAKSGKWSAARRVELSSRREKSVTAVFWASCIGTLLAGLVGFYGTMAMDVRLNSFRPIGELFSNGIMFGLLGSFLGFRFFPNVLRATVALQRIEKGLPEEHDAVSDPLLIAAHQIHEMAMALDRRIDAWNLYLEGVEKEVIERSSAEEEQRRELVDAAAAATRYLNALDIALRMRAANAGVETLQVTEILRGLADAHQRLEAYFSLEDKIAVRLGKVPQIAAAVPSAARPRSEST